MSDRIEVNPAALEQPAKRFEAGAQSLERIGTALREAARAAGQAAQHQAISQAGEVFGTGMDGALRPFEGECRAMSGKLAAAGVRYHVTDETAVVVQVVDFDLSGLDGPGGKPQ